MSEKKLISEQIDIGSFKNLKHVIYVHNDTSQTEIVDPFKVSITELLEKGLFLEIPKNSCQVSHLLTLYFIEEDKAVVLKKLPAAGKDMKEATCSMVGKVMELIPSNDQKNKIIVKVIFTQYNEKKWSAFVDLYQSKQVEINDFCKLARY